MLSTIAAIVSNTLTALFLTCAACFIAGVAFGVYVADRIR